MAPDSREAHRQAYRFLVAQGAVTAVIPVDSGVAPTHDVSQLSQSGAKIAPLKKVKEEPKKSEEQEQRKDDKR